MSPASIRGAATSAASTLVLAALATPAGAITTSMDAGTLRITSPAGEAFVGHVDDFAPGLVRVVAFSGTVTAGPGCTQEAAGVAECPLPAEIDADFGDRDDGFGVSFPGAPSALRGGDGDDTLFKGEDYAAPPNSPARNDVL